MDVVGTIKNADPDKLRKWIVVLVVIGVLIIYPDLIIGTVNIFLNLLGMGGIGSIPPSFWFMIFAVFFFGFALFLMMILQKKKQIKQTRPKDLIAKGFCDICCNPKARNILPMDYKEEGKDDAIIYVCGKCRDDVKEIREEEKNDKRS